MRPEDAADLEDARALLLALRDEAGGGEAADALYSRWYHRGDETSRLYPSAGAYRAATALPALFETGWTVTDPAPGPPGAVVAARAGGAPRLVAAGDHAPERPAAAPAPESPVRVLDRVESEENGFWHLWSRAWRGAPPTRVERVYLQVAPGREIEFAGCFAAAAPNDACWYVKLLAGAHQSGRRDAAVLFLPAGGTGAEWLALLLTSAADTLDDARPRFAAALAPGAAWADDPGDCSFGQRVCAVLAAAAAAADDGDAFRAAAAAAGLDLERPHRVRRDDHRA